MRTPSFASLAVAASAFIATVSAADLDPIVVKGSSECPITYFIYLFTLFWMLANIWV